MEPEFVIDEEPVALAADLQGAVAEAIRREARLRNRLQHQDLKQAQELSKAKNFLQALIAAMENRCEELIKAERRRLEGADDRSQGEAEKKWLRRVQRIQEAFTNTLAAYGVTRFEPTGLALPDRDEIRDREPSPEHEPGTILRIVAPGYLWQGEVLRPAQVVVCAGETHSGRRA